MIQLSAECLKNVFARNYLETVNRRNNGINLKNKRTDRHFGSVNFVSWLSDAQWSIQGLKAYPPTAVYQFQWLFRSRQYKSMTSKGKISLFQGIIAGRVECSGRNPNRIQATRIICQSSVKVQWILTPWSRIFLERLHLIQKCDILGVTGGTGNLNFRTLNIPWTINSCETDPDI